MDVGGKATHSMRDFAHMPEEPTTPALVQLVHPPIDAASAGDIDAGVED
jgi:hypothetical protein